MPSDLTVGNWRGGASRQVLQVVSEVERSSARGRGPSTPVENAVLGLVNLLDGYDSYIQTQEAESEPIDPNQLAAYDLLANQSGNKKVKGGVEVDAPTEVIDEDNKPLPVGFGQIEQVQQANATDGASSPVVAAPSTDSAHNDVGRRRELQEQAQPQPNPLQVEASVNDADAVREVAAEQYQETHDYVTEQESGVDQQEAQAVAEAQADRAVTGKPGAVYLGDGDNQSATDEGDAGDDASARVGRKRKSK